MNCKLIAFDLDGTFLDDFKRIPEENIRALEEAGRRGIVIVPASGRLYPYLPEEVRALPGAKYFITANGNGVYDAVEDRLLYTAYIEIEDALCLVDYMDTLDVLYDCYADNLGFTQESFWNKADDFFTTPVMNNMFHSYIKLSRSTVDNLRTFISGRSAPLQKMQMFFHDTDREGKLRQLELLPGMFPQFVFSSSLPNNIEVNSTRATKGQALAALCTELGIAPEETVVFGDGTNDLDMIAFSGNGVAMVNGAEEVKAAARFLSETDNNHAGVARTLEKMKIL